MLFNSFEFLVFLLVVFFVYWFLVAKNLKLQNIFLIIAAFVFYGWWDWRFLFLLVGISLIDYLTGINIEKASNPKIKKLILGISLISNLGILGTFKYFNFFSESLTVLFHSIGFNADFITLNLILPVGISFYTFQNMSYTIDVYYKKLEPTRDIISYFAYVSFFPQVLAGPIERAKNLLPQFFVKRSFDRLKAEDGLRQILWGLFKKIVIADNCAIYVDNIFSNYQTMESSYIFLGVFYFAFQIYGDFSGYSDIAIGTGRLFGIHLSQNFAFPYFSRDIAEFWRRWHMSLTTWFRNYIYIPLGGNQVSDGRKIFNVMAVFLISGFWHGANWTFVFWGLLNGLYFLPLMLFKTHKKNTNVIAENRIFPSIREVFGVLLTFSLTLLAWIFFRADNLTTAFDIISRLFTPSIFTMPTSMKSIIPLIGFMLVVEWFQRTKQHGLEIDHIPQPLRWVSYCVILGLIAYFASDQDVAFIYFQF